MKFVSEKKTKTIGLDNVLHISASEVCLSYFKQGGTLFSPQTTITIAKKINLTLANFPFLAIPSFYTTIIKCVECAIQDLSKPKQVVNIAMQTSE